MRQAEGHVLMKKGNAEECMQESCLQSSYVIRIHFVFRTTSLRSKLLVSTCGPQSCLGLWGSVNSPQYGGIMAHIEGFWVEQAIWVLMDT